MGKLETRLNQQLKTEFKKEAEDCLKIFNKLKELNNGKVWESQWYPLTTVEFKGSYPYQRVYKPTAMGYTFIKGID